MIAQNFFAMVCDAEEALREGCTEEAMLVLSDLRERMCFVISSLFKDDATELTDQEDQTLH